MTDGDPYRFKNFEGYQRGSAGMIFQDMALWRVKICQPKGNTPRNLECLEARIYGGCKWCGREESNLESYHFLRLIIIDNNGKMGLLYFL